MSSKMSLNGYGTGYATFAAAKGAKLKLGAPVVLKENHTVDAGQAENPVVGAVEALRGELVLVQLAGVRRFTYSGSAPTLGWVQLLADGTGGVKVGQTGKPVLVTWVDSQSKLVEVIL